MQRKFLLFASIILVSIGFFCTSCNNKEDLFATNVQLQSPVGKTWRLSGFANTQNADVKMAFTNNMDFSYRITFKKDSTWVGTSSTNELQGKYSIDKARRLLSFTAMGGTKINETGSGNQYLECLRNVFSYEVFEDELRLFYTKERYLKYVPYTSNQLNR